MNENLNLVEILKDCPSGTKLYSPIFGDVEFVEILQEENVIYPIRIKLSKSATGNFTKDGKIYAEYSGECVLFPSKEQRDWSKFKPKQTKFDPKTLKPFDKVLVRNSDSERWRVQLFSHITEPVEKFPYVCINTRCKYCIPYNDDTKHLVGTTDEAPEYYINWED